MCLLGSAQNTVRNAISYMHDLFEKRIFMKIIKRTALFLSIAIFITLTGTGKYIFSDNPSVLSQSTNNIGDTVVVSTAAEPIVAGAPDGQKLAEAYGKLPIYFEPNVGQADESVRFLARGRGYSVALKDDVAVISLRKPVAGKQRAVEATVAMQIVGGNAMPTFMGTEQTEGRSNYLIGNDPANWHSDIPNYRQVRSGQVLTGIDAIYYGNGRQLEYDLIAAPGSDPSKIALKFDGPRSARIDRRSGDLLLDTGAGTIRQLKPVVYQQTGDGRTEIAAEYALKRDGDSYTVSFLIADYDRSKDLIIDPILSYGSYLGGLGFEEGRGIAIDAAGNAYVVGTTASTNFPTTPGTIKPVALPRTDSTSYWNDAFVTKVNAAGTAIVWSTYYGGRNGSEIGTGVAVSSAGEVLISGTTTAADLPVVNAYQSTFGGTDDAFAAKLNSTGSAIIYSTYLGGNNTDTGGRIALNRTTGEAVFAGYASSGNFPTTQDAYKEKLCDGTPGSCNGIFYSGSYIVKLTTAGNVVYSSLFDALVNDVTLDDADDAVLGGSVGVTNFPTTPGAFQPASSGGVEGFIAKLNPGGNALLYGTYLGGGFQSDRVNAITLDAAGNMYVTGQTQSTAFPVTAGAYDQTFNGGEDGFVTKLNPAGSALVYSTFFGGQGKDQPFAIGLGADNSVLIAGETLSGATFPLRNSLVGSTGSIFVTRFDTGATALVYSTLVGQGGAYAMAVDSASNAYITGHTTNILVTPDAFQPGRGATDPASPSSSPDDAFVMKIATADESAVSYAISGTVTDDNYGYNNDYSPIVVTISGTVNRSYSPSNGGSGTVAYTFANLPGGGNYTITARKAGYDTDPQSVVLNNLGANQFADFHILRNHAPEGVITSPVHGAMFNAPASITIQATASDPDGDAIQKVDFVAYNSVTGSIPLGADTTAPYEFTWTNVPLGTFALYAIPTDSRGLRGTSTQVVQVSVVDPSPVGVSFIAPIEGPTFVEGDYIPVGVAVSPSVTLVQVRDQNGNLVAWLPNSPWSSTWRPLVVGDFTLTATAQNSLGQTAVSAPLHVRVGRINHRVTGTIVDSITGSPLAGVNLSLVCPSTPGISAQATTDAAGNYIFTDLGTTPNDSITITPSVAGYTFDPPSRSTGYLGYITNWTNQNYTAIHSTGITVSLTSPTNGQVLTAPASFTVAASASSTAGAITKVDFYRATSTPQLIGTDTTAPFELPLSGVAAGSYGYFARATDSTGAAADSATSVITVNLPATSVALHGEVHNPGGGPMIGILVRLTGTANGSPVTQTWTTNTNGSFLFNVPTGGSYTIAPEGTGVTFTPPSILFTNVTQDIYDILFVSSAVNQAPSVQINSPLDGSTYTMPAAIPVNVTATDADGSVVHLQVTAQSRTMSTTIGQANNGTASFSWQPNLPGVYTLYAIATDNGGLRTTISITVTVNQPSPTSISGRVVDRSSFGIEGVTLELRDLGTEALIASSLTDIAGHYTIPNVTTFGNYVLRASKADYSFSPQKRVYVNFAATVTDADYTGTLQVPFSDFDGDGRSDIAVWRPSTGVWHISRSFDNGYNASQFGGAAFGDVVVPGNYDGDKKIDYAVYRNGIWYILSSYNGSVRTVSFGLPGDAPVPGDYDGDGKTDLAVWRPTDGNWHILRSSDGAYTPLHFGLTGDVPLTGDFDGDGLNDLAVWRPQNGTWYVQHSTDGSVAAVKFGQSGDMPLIGDFDGDKKIDFTIFRPSTGVWYVLKSSDGAFNIRQWGISTDKPVPGDYDHDGKTDMAVFREAEGNWYVLKSSTGDFAVTHFGMTGDIPIPAAYIR